MLLKRFIIPTQQVELELRIYLHKFQFKPSLFFDFEKSEFGMIISHCISWIWFTFDIDTRFYKENKRREENENSMCNMQSSN